MRHIVISALVTIVSLACSGCGDTQSAKGVVVFRLTDAATATPLTNVVVSVFDGFDRSTGVRSNNAPYHFADIKISADGLLHLDLSQLKEDTILIESGGLHKYIRHEGHMVKVVHYNREGKSLRVTAHYDYDLDSNLVTVTRFPSEISEPPEAFAHIDVPMD